MPHNPRYTRERYPEPVVLADAQITEAMCWALGLMRRTAIDPAPGEAAAGREPVGLTVNYHSWHYRMHHRGSDPW